MSGIVTYQDILRVAQTLPVTEGQTPWDEVARIFYRRLTWHGPHENYGIETVHQKEQDPQHPVVIQMGSMMKLIGEVSQLHALLWVDKQEGQLIRLYWALAEDIVQRSMAAALAAVPPAKGPLCDHCGGPMKEDSTHRYYCRSCSPHHIS